MHVPVYIISLLSIFTIFTIFIINLSNFEHPCWKFLKMFISVFIWNIVAISRLIHRFNLSSLIPWIFTCTLTFVLSLVFFNKVIHLSLQFDSFEMTIIMDNITAKVFRLQPKFCWQPIDAVCMTVTRLLANKSGRKSLASSHQIYNSCECYFLQIHFATRSYQLWTVYLHVKTSNVLLQLPLCCL